MKRFQLRSVLAIFMFAFALNMTAQNPNEFLMFKFENGYFKKSDKAWSQFGYKNRMPIAQFTEQKADDKYYYLLDKEQKNTVRVPLEAQSAYQTREIEAGKWKDAAVITGIHRAISMTDAQKQNGAKQQTAQQAAGKVKVGDSFIEIISPDEKGEKIALSSLVGRGVVLVDFWASWCGPCMGEVPFLVDAYSKYHEKGFEIYGVSLDSKKENWLAAIESKNMNWVQVSDLAGWKDVNVEKYGVRGIPANFLIDKDGKVIAINLRQTQLEDKLAEIFGE